MMLLKVLKVTLVMRFKEWRCCCPDGGVSGGNSSGGGVGVDGRGCGGSCDKEQTKKCRGDRPNKIPIQIP